MAAHYEIGKDRHGYGYGGTGKKSFNSTFVDYGGTYRDNDVIGCSIDLDSTPATVAYSKNGVDLGVAFEIAPHLNGSTFFPAIVCKESGIRVCFGGGGVNGDLKYTPNTNTNTNTKTNSPYTPIGGYADVISSTSKTAFEFESNNTNNSTNGNNGTNKNNNSNNRTRTPLAIIVKPSWELANQVYENMIQFTKYVSEPSLKVSLLVGGESQKKKQNGSNSNSCDIVIGTPGKLGDLVKRKLLDLSMIK